MDNPIQISIYDDVKQAIGDVPTMMATKATMVHVSHILEDIVLKNKLPAYMFTGFQESSHWKHETERYRELANVAHQVCVFAGKPMPDDFVGHVSQVTLTGDDPLRQEWFVVILSETFSVLLAGKDQQVSHHDERDRLFEAILSFTPDVLNITLDTIENILSQYYPEMRDQLHATRQKYPVPHTDYHYISNVMTQIIVFEEYLQSALRSQEKKQHKLAMLMRDERDVQSQIVDNSPVYLLTMSLDGQLLTMNNFLKQTIGFYQDVAGSSDAMAKFNIQFIDDYVQDSDKIAFQQSLDAIRLTGLNYTFDAYLKVRNGIILPVEWQLRLIQENDHSPYILALGYDLTQRLWVEELQEARKRLELSLEAKTKLDEMRSQFIKTVSHEFRTPLSVILSSTELIEKYFDELSPKSRQKRLNNIREQVLHMVNMLNDVALMDSVQNRKLNLDLQMLSVDTIIRNQIVSIQKTLSPVSRQIQFTSNMQSFEPFLMDQSLIHQIVNNLLTNAIKYSQQDIICHLEATNNTVRLMVKDTGIGIPESDQKHIFEAFYRNENAEYVTGTGLGLTIVSSYVAIHQGEIKLQSAVNEGTQIDVILPYQKKADGTLRFSYDESLIIADDLLE